jgi:hypothetical protein
LGGGTYLYEARERWQCRRERALKPYKRDSSGVAPASPQVAYARARALGRKKLVVFSAPAEVILVGNLGRDPEIRHTRDDRPVANLTVATSETWRDKARGERREKTEWHRVVIFNEGLNGAAAGGPSAQGPSRAAFLRHQGSLSMSMSLTESTSTEKSTATMAASLPITKPAWLARLISSVLGEAMADEEATASRA